MISSIETDGGLMACRFPTRLATARSGVEGAVANGDELTAGRRDTGYFALMPG